MSAQRRYRGSPTQAYLRMLTAFISESHKLVPEGDGKSSARRALPQLWTLHSALWQSHEPCDRRVWGQCSLNFSCPTLWGAKSCQGHRSQRPMLTSPSLSEAAVERCPNLSFKGPDPFSPWINAKVLGNPIPLKLFPSSQVFCGSGTAVGGAY